MVNPTKLKLWLSDLDIRDVSNLRPVLRHQLLFSGCCWKPEDSSFWKQFLFRVFCKMMMLVLIIQFGKERCNVT
uniref:Uncharacterized protein n=2 Tax=Rhizophora mucronata TaxID=61149 RepID=A0A2P2MRQ4_RHIMU